MLLVLVNIMETHTQMLVALLTLFEKTESLMSHYSKIQPTNHTVHCDIYKINLTSIFNLSLFLHTFFRNLLSNKSMARNITYRIHNLHIWFQLHVAMLFCISPHEAVLCVSNYITASTRHVHMLTVLVRFQTNEI